MNNLDSILDSVKTLLGLDPESDEFNTDVLVHINAAIFTLQQLGVGPAFPFVVTSRKEKFSEYLEDNELLIQEVRLYIFYKVKLGFDPPSVSAVIEVLKEMIKEAEVRINMQVDPGDTFES